ncbi:MAG: 6-phosphogluconolactonase [Verrucomicrobia bacterium]|nr:6-phosphogluconolactonase [Verrucomicrobiota bacterium]
MNRTELMAFPDTGTLVQQVAGRWLDAVEASAAGGQPFHVALPGGRVAGRFMAAAQALGASRGTRWGHVQFHWGDERCVPPDHADSNYLLAQTALLDPAGIPVDHRHRLRGELPPEEAAHLAEAELARVTGTPASGVPVLDLMFLGMGEDGHVASLFPGAPKSVTNSDRWVLPVVGPKPPPQRLSLTFRVLAAAKEVWVLASGAGKEEALAQSLRPGGTTPLAHLISLRERTSLLTDLPLPS